MRRAQRGNWLPNAPSVTKLICASYAPGYKNTQGAKGLDAPGPWGAGALEPVVMMKGGQKSMKYIKLVVRPLINLKGGVLVSGGNAPSVKGHLLEKRPFP